jgi:hypothetical protein
MWMSCTHGGWIRGLGVVHRGVVGKPSIVDAWDGHLIYSENDSNSPYA